MMGGFIALIALLGKDAVHDAYTTIIQPRLKPWLERISGMMPGASSQHKAVSVMLYYEEFRVCVRVDSVADTLPAAAKQAHLIEEVHRTALAWIQAHGPQKPVHYYRIEDGQVNAEPVLYDHVLQVK
jgi:hypothetical protein